MSFWNPFRADPLQLPSPKSTAEYLCRLLEEQNSLLREMLTAMGHKATTPRSGSPRTAPDRIRTDKDVFVVGRSQLQQQGRAKAEREQAPWRTPVSGPDSAQSQPQDSSADSPGSAPPKGT